MDLGVVCMYCRTRCTFPRRLELCNAIFIHMVLISGMFSQLVAHTGKCISVWDRTHTHNQGAVPYPDSDQLLQGLAPHELVVLMTSDLVQRQCLEAGNDRQGDYAHGQGLSGSMTASQYSHWNPPLGFLLTVQ